MEIKNQSSQVIETNLDTEEQEFGIGDPTILISLLRDLYANPIRTLTQEYLCNGRDTTREKGENTPLKVTLPSALSPVLKIRDYGVGLSPERLQNVFIRYGNSTKRTSNAFTGGFGIGAKSAWAYAEEFVVTTYYDGWCRSYAAHLGKNNRGSLKLLMEAPSSEPTGTEIQIGVESYDINAFTKAVYRATLFWDVKPEIRGVLPEEIPAYYYNVEQEAYYKTDKWLLLKSKNFNDFISTSGHYYNAPAEVYFSVDGILYPLPEVFRRLPAVKAYQATVTNGYTLVVRLDNGVIEITPTRESLKDTAGNSAEIEKILAEATASLINEANADFAAVTNLQDFLKLHQKQSFIFGSKEAKFEDFTVTRNGALEYPNFHLHARAEKFSVAKLRSGKTVIEKDMARNIQAQNCVFFYHDVEEGPNKTRERVRKFLAANEGVDRLYLLSFKDDAVALPALAETPIPSLEAYQTLLDKHMAQPISSLPLPEVVKTARQKADNRGKIAVRLLNKERALNNYRNVLASENVFMTPEALGRGQFVYLDLQDNRVDFQEYGSDKMLELAGYLKKHGVQLCALTETAKKKLSGFTNFTPFKEFIGQLESKIPLSNEARMQIKKDLWPNELRLLSRFASVMDQIKDPRFTALFNKHEEMSQVEVHNRAEALSASLLKFYTLAHTEINQEISDVQNTFDKLKQDYRLVTLSPQYNSDFNCYVKDFVEYINIKYAHDTITKSEKEVKKGKKKSA